MTDFSPKQKKIIDGYYRNRDDIMVAKLSELVSDLYLADTDAKRKRLWDRAAAAMRNLKWKPAVITHILDAQKPEVLAKNLEDWLKRAPTDAR